MFSDRFLGFPSDQVQYLEMGIAKEVRTREWEIGVRV